MAYSCKAGWYRVHGCDVTGVSRTRIEARPAGVRGIGDSRDLVGVLVVSAVKTSHWPAVRLPNLVALLVTAVEPAVTVTLRRTVWIADVVAAPLARVALLITALRVRLVSLVIARPCIESCRHHCRRSGNWSRP